MKKFTFRKEAQTTGLAGVGFPIPSTTIKLAGKWVGTISAPNYTTKDHKWGVELTVGEKATENCPWGWVFFANRFDTEPNAREWLLRNQAALMERYTIISPDSE